MTPVTVLLPASLERTKSTLTAILSEGRPSGVECLLYGSAEEAIRYIADHDVRLMVMEFSSDGREQRGLIALAGQAHREIPVILVAPESFSPDQKLLKGVFDVLIKPFTDDQFIRLARNTLRWGETRHLLQEKQQELDLIDEVGKTIISSLELKTVLNIIMEKTRELVPSEAWSLLLVDEDTEELHFSVAIGEHVDDNLREFKLKMGEGVAGWVAREGKPLVVQDVSDDPRFFNEIDRTLGFETRSILCVPLETRGRVLGVIEVINKKGTGLFSDRDKNLVTRLAGLAAVAIENARLYHQTKLLTLTDELTHLYNSRFFNQFLESEVKRCRRYDSHVSLIFLDLDYFKRINDEHGHLLGSKLLKEAAEILLEGLRDVDIVARYGGDEFLVILPETQIDEAAFVAERMRRSFEENRFLEEDGLGVQVTASFGVAAFPEFSSSKEELVRFADQAMYKVKNKNRNGVFVVNDNSIFKDEETQTK